jgi:YggT family protein
MGRSSWYATDSRNNKKKRPGLRWPNRKQWIWIALVLLSLILAGVSVGFQPAWTDFILSCISYFCRILALLVFVRALISWFRPDSYSWPMVMLYDLTDPILTPLRRIMPSFGGLDLTPLLAILILYFVPSVVGSLVHLFVS